MQHQYRLCKSHIHCKALHIHCVALALLYEQHSNQAVWQIMVPNMLVHTAIQVRLLLLAALAQEHILYIGPPGTAKSELGRRLSRLCKGTFFERLLTRFSVPEVTSHLCLHGPLLYLIAYIQKDKGTGQPCIHTDMLCSCTHACLVANDQLSD